MLLRPQTSHGLNLLQVLALDGKCKTFDKSGKMLFHRNSECCKVKERLKLLTLKKYLSVISIGCKTLSC